MKELRRLFIDQLRLQESERFNSSIVLLQEELHYTRRVLRLHDGDLINVVDGVGNLWEAIIDTSTSIKLTSSFDKPLIQRPSPNMKVCLAIVPPKKGFEDILRMGSEMGVDIFQPLISEYRVDNWGNESKVLRCSKILREAIEQSERLWLPELRNNSRIEDWLTYMSSECVFIACTRIKELKYLPTVMSGLNKTVKNVWVLIGPEGGWTNKEFSFAIEKAGCIPVSLGENILRTSTAALMASQCLISWRRHNFGSSF